MAIADIKPISPRLRMDSQPAPYRVTSGPELRRERVMELRDEYIVANKAIPSAALMEEYLATATILYPQNGDYTVDINGVATWRGRY